MRLQQRFDSFVKRQLASAYFSQKLMSFSKTQAEKHGKKIIILFGDCKFSPGGSGYASVPRKLFIKELGIRYPTIITSEFRTSKLFPKEFKELKQIETTKNVGRLRQCAIESVAPNCSDVIRQQPAYDRYALGSVGICQKGFYILIGKPIPFYERTAIAA